MTWSITQLSAGSPAEAKSASKLRRLCSAFFAIGCALVIAVSGSTAKAQTVPRTAHPAQPVLVRSLREMVFAAAAPAHARRM